MPLARQCRCIPGAFQVHPAWERAQGPASCIPQQLDWQGRAHKSCQCTHHLLQWILVGPCGILKQARHTHAAASANCSRSGKALVLLQTQCCMLQQGGRCQQHSTLQLNR